MTAQVLISVLQLQFVASINKMVAAYDQGARRDQCRVADTRTDALQLKAKLDSLESKHAAELASSLARIDILEKENNFFKEESIKVGDLAMRLGYSK